MKMKLKKLITENEVKTKQPLERCNISFDFQKNAKNISIFLTSCKKCKKFFLT